ncbi:MAG: peptidylprolyl isomerase [Chloroflexi bacterium]|nr:peptidylprolyl isomerase [Chloroflexota bacterium]
MSRKQRATQVRPPTQRQLSRWQRERRLQRLVIALGAVVLTLAFAIPAYGYYREVVARGLEPIARVNDRSFSVNEYIKRMMYQDFQYDLVQQSLQSQQAQAGSSDTSKLLAGLAGQQLQQLQMERASMGIQVVEDLINGEVIAQSVGKLGISAAPDEVAAGMKDRLVGRPQEGEQVDEAKRQADFEDRLRFVLAQTGLSEEEYRGYVRNDVLREKLDQYLRSQVPTSAEQVHVQAILVQTKEEAAEVQKRLTAGEDFAVVATEKTLDTAYKEKGGDMGWLPRGVQPEAFETAAFALQVGQISEPVETPTGYYLLKLLARETREIEADRLEQLRSRALGQWLDQTEKEVTIERFLNSDKQLWATDQVIKQREKRLRTGTRR